MKLGHKKIIQGFFLFMALGVYSSCTLNQASSKSSSEYSSLPGVIPILKPTHEQREKFNRDIPASFITVQKSNDILLSGYVTGNQDFLEQVITPLLQPHLEKLSKQHPVEMINTLTLFGFELYRIYFGEPSHTWEFYRWGGDLFDLDDPQEKGHRHEYKYGLDCSGFVSLPYDLAVYYKLMDAEDEAALFSSKGFENYCHKYRIIDRGGRKGTSNHFRIDSVDAKNLGREIFSFKGGEYPKPEDLERLQAGDLISGPGHVAILVEVKDKLYYLESGRDVLPPKGKILIPAAEGIKIFGERYSPYTIRRSLPDYGRINRTFTRK